jgi:hypothetical protein
VPLENLKVCGNDTHTTVYGVMHRIGKSDGGNYYTMVSAGYGLGIPAVNLSVKRTSSGSDFACILLMT